MKKYSTFNDHLKHELKDPKFKEAFDREDFYVRVAVQIAKIREKKQMTQKDLAMKLHTTQQAVSRIEKGDQNITLNMIERLAEALDKKPVLKLV